MEEEEALLGHPASPKPRKQQFPLPRFRTSITFVLTALFTGFLFYFVVFSVILSKPSLRASSKDYLFGDDGQEPLYQTVTVTATYSPPLPTYLEEKPPGLNVEGLVELSKEELREMIDSTKGYLVRDWSLGLGWNNMRYIVEAAILQADLLNRTLVLPSFVYARACEYHNDVCAKYATMVNRGDAIGSDEWRDLPIEKQMAWKIPIEVMIDLPHLRQNHKVITLAEYFVLQGLDTSRETSNGSWDRDYYHNGIDHPSLFVLQNHDYDPNGVARVDFWDPAAYQRPNFTWVTHEKAVKFDEKLIAKSADKEKTVLQWKDAKAAIESVMTITNDTQIEEALQAAGWVILHTFEGDLGMDYTKTVIRPIKEATRYDRIHGFIQEYANVTDDVFLIEGEIHLGRKPGFMFYPTEAGRDKFARIVLQDLRVSERVVTLANKAIARMSLLNDGRTWMSAHMRRGDFSTLGWAMEAKLEDHYRRILERLGRGRAILERIQYLLPEPYHVPDVQPNIALFNKKPPKEGDYLYLATDERSEDGLRYLRENKAVLFNDVVTKEDRREFGWPLLYTDVAALVEQYIIGHGAGYFYAHAMSSVAGGILNLRASSGCDRRTALLD